MESTEVSNVPVNNRNVCKSNIGDDSDATVIKDAKEDNIIIENIEGNITLGILSGFGLSAFVKS